MKAFWWFKENSIAGMARPGFNSVRWFDLPFDEAVLLGWLGQYSEGPAPLAGLTHHLQTYVPKIYKYHKLDEKSGQQAVQILNSQAGILTVLQRLNSKLPVVSSYDIKNDQLHFKLSEEILNREIDFLKKNEIRNVITLTERHHQKDILGTHFYTHHISIVDLGAPNLNQAKQLAEIFSAANRNREKLVVHCLAGIGRTSTMLMSAHILLGESLDDLEVLIAKQNPYFALSGPQSDFLRTLKV